MKTYHFSFFVLLGSTLSGCSSLVHPSEVTLSIRYVAMRSDASAETGFVFEEDAEYPDLIETFSYAYGHSIDQEDYDEVYSAASAFIPHNEGGYYSLVGFNSSMEAPTIAGMFQVGYECFSNATFYYSYEGGNALPD